MSERETIRVEESFKGVEGRDVKVIGMPKVIEVIENEVFKPLEKNNLPEKTRLKIKIEDIEVVEV